MKIDVSKSLKKSLLMLSGDESILRDRALQQMVEAGSGGEDFDQETYVADSSAVSTWLAAAGTAPFLSPKRTVVVRNLCRNDGHKELKAKSLPPHALLLLVADDEVGDYDRQKRLTVVREAWEKAVVAMGGEVVKCTVDDKNIVKSIREEAEGFGKKMSEQAAQTLREMTGGSFSRAREELEKLVFYVGDQSQITEKEIRAVAIASPEWNVYKLVDSITRRDYGEAFRQLKNMVGSNPKVDDVAFQTIFPTLNRQFKLLWQARACIEAKIAPDDAPADFARQMPDRPNFLRDPEWRRNRTLQAARSLTFEAQAACMASLSNADARFKGLLPSFSHIDTLERMVLEMIEAVSLENLPGRV